jgi:hypothetical protein
MQNTLPNNKNPHSHQNIFLQESKSQTTTNSSYKKSKESTDVRQDKGVLTIARAASLQPAPLSNRPGARAFLNSNSARTRNSTRRVKLVHTTSHMNPLVRAELERVAEREGLSLSQVVAIACEEWTHQKLHTQHEALLYPIIRKIIREELQSFGNRIVFFLMKIAFPAEQARILTTNVLKWVCKLAGLDLKAYYKMVDDSSDLAKKNIIAKSPQTKALMDKWGDMFADKRQEEKQKGKEEKNKR